MKNTLLTLSKKLLRRQENLLCKLDDIFKEMHIDYLLVGASARDIILEYVYGIRCLRATTDIDFALSIDSWAAYKKVFQVLQERLGFESHPQQAHRLQSYQFGIIDLVPFGVIEKNNEIAWPPDYAIKMNLLGFNDVYKAAVSVEIKQGYAIPVVSLAGLAVLKLMAWQDRGYLEKDATDFVFIWRNYLNAGNLERLFSEFEQASKDDFDYDEMSSVLLGFDMRQIMSRACCEELIVILKKESSSLEGKLVSHMADSLAGIDSPDNKASRMIHKILDELSKSSKS